MSQDGVEHRKGYPSSSGKATVYGAPETSGASGQGRRPGGFWHTALGTDLLTIANDLFAEELAEIERARQDLERALEADAWARRQLILIQNGLAACEAALANLPYERSQPLLESDDVALDGLRDERDRLFAEQGRLRERLIEAKARTAKVATDERQETDGFARRVREAHARAKAKRNEIHDCLERAFKEVDDRLMEAWFVALAFGSLELADEDPDQDQQ